MWGIQRSVIEARNDGERDCVIVVHHQAWTIRVHDVSVSVVLLLVAEEPHMLHLSIEHTWPHSLLSPGDNNIRHEQGLTKNNNTSPWLEYNGSTSPCVWEPHMLHLSTKHTRPHSAALALWYSHLEWERNNIEQRYCALKPCTYNVKHIKQF